jgi:hypothetical protein
MTLPVQKVSGKEEAMSVLVRSRSLLRLEVVVSLALMGLVFAPSAFASQLDTATATGSTGNELFSNINISAQSGTSGQNPNGTASFSVLGILEVSGPVTCLSITGPDQGPGTVGSPTTAVLNFESSSVGVVTVRLVDNGGNGADTFFAEPSGRSPTDCSPLPLEDAITLTNGRATVFDAPVLPTSKDQCKDGGWRTFEVFRNQGDCVSFVATRGKNQLG